MKFSREFLRDILYASDVSVEDRIVGHSRWSVQHRQVFRHDGKLYETHYSVGATESQDERPYQYDGKEIECAEVWPVEKTVIVYEPVAQ